MKEELVPSLKQTGAKAISELRKLERRNSFDIQVKVTPSLVFSCDFFWSFSFRHQLPKLIGVGFVPS